jgi:HK97 gp10 family phage protein
MAVRITWTPEEAIAGVQRGAFAGVLKAANEVRNEVLRLIQQTPKTGRLYQRRGVTHQASAPGEAPASDTGNLVRNITVEVDPSIMSATVVSNDAYAELLEFGTTKMAPRPYMRAALDSMKDTIEDIVGDEVEVELE